MANLQLSSNLYKYRKLYGYTQEKLSQFLNISRQAYSNYETGKRDPDLDLLIKLSEIYQISLDQLVHQSFSSRNAIIRETAPPYAMAVESISHDTLYLSKEEMFLLLKFREAGKEKQHVILRLLEG